MTCPACQKSLAPGAHCADGHPPRRARRLSGEEKRAAERAQEEAQKAAEAHTARVRAARPVVDSSEHRRWLYRRGELPAELAEAMEVGLLSGEDAARLLEETPREVEAIREAQSPEGRARAAEKRRAEYEAWLATNPPVDAVDVGEPVEVEERREPITSTVPRRHSRALLSLGVVAMLGPLTTMPPEER